MVYFIAYILIYFTNPYIYTDLYSASLNFENSFVFTTSSFLVLFPIVHNLKNIFFHRVYVIEFPSLFSALSYSIFILPLQSFLHLDFYNTVDLGNSLQEALKFVAYFYFILWTTVYYYCFTRKIDLNFNPLFFDKVFKTEEISMGAKVLAIYVITTLYFRQFDILSRLGFSQATVIISTLVYFFIGYCLSFGKITERIFALIFLVLMTVYALYTTQFGYITLPFAFVLLFSFYKSKRLTLLYASIGFILMFSLGGIKHDVRSKIWGKEASISNVLDLWSSAIEQNFYSDGSYHSAVKSEQNSYNRLGHIALLTYIIDSTPSKTPHWNFQSYSLFFTKIIPRFLWPNKPRETLGNQFGRKYNIIGYNDYSTSINLPIVVEAFVSFGWFGLFMAYIIGLIVYYSIKQINSQYFGWKLFGIYIFFSILGMESNLSLLVGNTFLLWILVKYVFSKYTFFNFSFYNMPESK